MNYFYKYFIKKDIKNNNYFIIFLYPYKNDDKTFLILLFINNDLKNIY